MAETTSISRRPITALMRCRAIHETVETLAWEEITGADKAELTADINDNLQALADYIKRLEGIAGVGLVGGPTMSRRQS